MQERRHLARKIADEAINVVDINTGRPAGRVVNLTAEGMMLVGTAPVESNLVFQFELRLAQSRDGRDSLTLGAESLWCSHASEPGRYWSGYRVIDISLSVVEFIESMIDDWEEEEERH